MHDRKARFAVWSILFFLVPWAMAWRAGIFPLAIVLTAVIVLSFLNHLRRDNILLSLDTIFAWVLMILHFYLCILGRFSFPAFAGVLVFAPIAIFFYFRRARGVYDLNHGLWHLFSACVSIFAQLTYLTGAR